MQECTTWRGNWINVGHNKRRERNYDGHQTDTTVSIVILSFTLVNLCGPIQNECNMSDPCILLFTYATFLIYLSVSKLIFHKGSFKYEIYFSLKMDNSVLSRKTIFLQNYCFCSFTFCAQLIQIMNAGLFHLTSGPHDGLCEYRCLLLCCAM